MVGNEGADVMLDGSSVRSMHVQQRPETLGHQLPKASSVERSALSSQQTAAADANRRQPRGVVRSKDTTAPNHAGTDMICEHGQTNVMRSGNGSQ